MKIISFLIFFSIGTAANAQLLKNIGNGIKGDVEYYVEKKSREPINKGVDIKESKVEKKKGDTQQDKNLVQNQNTPDLTPNVSSEGQTQNSGSVEGFITLKLSTPLITKGLTVTISGESIKYQKWNTVKLLIKNPKDEEEVKLALNNNGKYSIVWNKLLEEGDYIITATSSDGKAQVSEKLIVIDFLDIRDENAKLIEVAGEAFNRLKKASDDLKKFISPTDAAKLDEKLNAVKENVDRLYKVVNSLRDAKKEVGNFLKKGGRPSQSLLQNMTDLNLTFMEKADEVRRISEKAEHPPFDNTICEYIALANEACAAFETFTNFWAKSVSGIIRNIMLDKVVPKANATAAGGVVPSVFKSEQIGEEYTWGVKKATKVFATAHFHMEEFHHKLGQAEFASAMIRFTTDVLLRAHCGVFKGKWEHYYNYYATNAQGKKWWDYAVHSEASLILRYPKSNSGVIRMKGTIEGNATRFDFYADPVLNPDYSQGAAGKLQTMIIKNYTPVSLPFATSLHDQLGFGAVARAIASPAYFLIPIDAEYNTETGKIKIFINEALVDYLPSVFNSQIFIQWAAGLPKLRRQDYPIQKARLTMKATLKENNEFAVTKDSRGNLAFKGTIKRHLKGEAGNNEHLMDITVNAKKE